jgi:DNA-binding response OmpR family regulator
VGTLRHAECSSAAFIVALGATRHAGSVRILVVEDEQRLADLLKDGLAREGFAVDLAPDGREGLWMATENPYDVIVLDVMLPYLDGYTVCARLRAAKVWTPILILTAKDAVLDEAQALDTGADDFLSKPFSYVILLARLRALLRRGIRERPAVITVGDLKVDPAGLRCSRGNSPITLTPKEFAILHGLARRAGQVITKSELLAQAWDFAYDGDSNIVEVYISALRRKIDKPFGRSTLVTVRGAGYRLEA